MQIPPNRRDGSVNRRYQRVLDRGVSRVSWQTCTLSMLVRDRRRAHFSALGHLHRSPRRPHAHLSTRRPANGQPPSSREASPRSREPPSTRTSPPHLNHGLMTRWLCSEDHGPSCDETRGEPRRIDHRKLKQITSGGFTIPSCLLVKQSAAATPPFDESCRAAHSNRLWPSLSVALDSRVMPLVPAGFCGEAITRHHGTSQA